MRPLNHLTVTEWTGRARTLRWRVVWAPFVSAVLVAGAACSRHPPADVTESASASAPPAAASVEVAKILSRELPSEEVLEAGEAEKAMIALVRRESWDEAWTAIDALPEPKKKRPTLRLLRGRIRGQDRRIREHAVPDEGHG